MGGGPRRVPDWLGQHLIGFAARHGYGVLDPLQGFGGEWW